MSEIAHVIDTVLADSLLPALKAAGYRKSGRTWRRAGHSSVRVVNAQGSNWNSTDSGRFTLNLGLYFPTLAPFVAWGRTSERPTELDCHVRMRIGHLLPAGLDHWWEVTPGTDLAALAMEVRSAWDRYAAPWFERYDDLEAARPLVARFYSYGAAAVSLALGERADAQRRLDEVLATSTQRSRADLIRAWARQNGLTVTAA